MRRKEKFSSGEIFHVFNKSIANFGIFKDLENGWRFIEVLDYYNNRLIDKSFSDVKFISYCIMPDHYHLLLKILYNNSFSKYLSDVENSFSRFFNIHFYRKGPLWQSNFKAVRIKSAEQLLHVSRYIHLNPTTANLVDKPEDWRLSSYNDFIKEGQFLKESIKEISISEPSSYKRFVEDNKDYQKKLKIIKKLILE
jgi:putative transposase